METQLEKLSSIELTINEILDKIREMELMYADDIAGVHPVYGKSALNLVHYLGLRCFDIDQLQDGLRELDLPSLSNAEAHVMKSLLSIKTIINYLKGSPLKEKLKG